ncbi:hypothetical protein LIER_12209 [Lithospermum erythrorhizon]|uniref:Reverse transcriptase/retrotransposon-derived protein RNase H-like domain-containing protein n=1 Tax=Lithospermum erythrorhizon TaxID=34254 RepID=A0AAV3PSD0_LITER
MISERGIEPDPEKIKALLEIKPPSSYKDIHKLTGCLAALSRYISKSGKQNLPFFKNLRKASTSKFHWDDECNKAFEDLKRYLGSPYLLSYPKEGEELQVYLAIEEGAISSVLVKGKCGVKNETLMKYHEKVVTMAKGFDQTIFQHVSRAQNEKTDKLSQLATTYYDAFLKEVYIELRDHPVYEEKVISSVLEDPNDWRTLIARRMDNCIVFSGLKKNMMQIGANKGAWPEELRTVLWSLRTTPSHATDETPFSLVYGTEVVLLVEVGVPLYRQRGFDEAEYSPRMREELNFTNELRDKALFKYKRLMARSYNRIVKNKQFRVGDLVLRMYAITHPNFKNKLSPKWEGPYKHPTKLRKYYI